MFAKAFLEEAGNGKLRQEEQLLKAVFERRGIPIELYTKKRIRRRQLPLTTETFIAGDLESMQGAMRLLKIEVPAAQDYPESLRPYLHRHVRKGTLGEVERAIIHGEREGIFVKPADRCKNFTGRVFDSIDDFRDIGGVSRRQSVWLCDVVSFVSEYRVYVIGEKVVSTALYAGDASARLDAETLQAALVTFRGSGEAPAAYGIDFGVLKNGQTALIEFNDGFSLGAYQIEAEDYTDLLMARWKQLVAAAPV